MSNIDFNIKISVIVPVYNGEIYLPSCLKSILNQTFTEFELIVVNDGSTDDTERLIKLFQEKDSRIKLLTQKNQGQGKARNFGLEHAKGEYVAFIDADDFIAPNFLLELFNTIKRHGADIAISDWIYFFGENKFNYTNSNQFIYYEILSDKEVEKFLASKVYFTVNKLYRKQFLFENMITYGEGYIYEDVEFFVNSYTKAKKICTVPNPYYYVRINEYSTTKTKFTTRKHYDDFLKAIYNTLKGQKFRSEFGPFDVYRYFLNRTRVYSQNRMPRNLSRHFIKDVFTILNKYDYKIIFPSNTATMTKFIMTKVLPKNDVDLFILHMKLSRNRVIKETFKFIKGLVKAPIQSIKNFIKKYLYKLFLSLPIRNNSVLFLGFDYEYRGNSRYLYDYLRKSDSRFQIKFLTYSPLVGSNNRFIPNTILARYYLATSKNIIAESWVPNWIEKRKNTNWIQLWHGSPIKKMLFDSNEFVISKANPDHKVNKFRDQRKWDYFICESTTIKQKFIDSFLLQPTNILAYGYSRVQYLIENKDNQILKNNIRKKLNIDQNSKIVFYAPTWRDYNLHASQIDYSYYLDLEQLKSHLPEDYIVMFKDHTYLETGFGQTNIIEIKQEIETQDILLVTDYLISDYSSILFDFIALEKPFFLYANDEEKYTSYRGLYEDVWKDLDIFKELDISKLAEKILNPNEEINEALKKLQEQYSSINPKFTNQNIEKLLI